eukprot:COSAG06_NODE_3811_length_4884_cov_11.896134_8_plen_350_part_01
MAAGHPWRLALLLAIAAATAGHSADAASRANGRRPLVAPALLATDRDEPMRDDLYRSQPRPTLPHESTEPDLIAATAGRLAAALLRALAEPPPTATPNNAGAQAEDPWRGAARELAGDLLADGRLPALLQEPVVAAAMARELRGLRCEAAAQDEQQQPHPPQRPDSGGGAGGAPLLDQPPPSGGAAIDSLRAHADAHVDEGDATAGSLRQRPPLPHDKKKQDESGGGGSLLRAPRSAGVSCAADGDCPLGQYCDSTGSCYECSYISPTQCDDISGDCCSAAFRTQCPANPAGCNCERDGDCSGGEVCSAGHCEYPGGDKAALLAAFVRDPRAAAAWGALRGWSNASEPCA